MDIELMHKRLALLFLPNFGHKRIKTILSQLKSEEEFFSVKKQTLKKIPGLGDALIRGLNRKLALEKAEKLLKYFESDSDIKIHFYRDDNYPKRLKECEDAPILLFSKGKMEINHKKTIAIVGTRNASSYGKTICTQVIEGLREKNIQVVSGLAYGIDILAHQLCIKNNIETIAVLGHGLDRIYPYEHRNTAKEMMKKGGLLTEFLPGTLPDKENFPMRNRIVAGMCDATIVIESGIKGGSLITADLAFDYNREVFAIPGDIFKTHSMGCNDLIKKNKAHLISSIDDVLKLMNWNLDKKDKKNESTLFPLSENENFIWSFFKEKEELYYDELYFLSKFSHSKLNEVLFLMEINGHIKAIPGKKYKINNSI